MTAFKPKLSIDLQLDEDCTSWMKIAPAGFHFSYLSYCQILLNIITSFIYPFNLSILLYYLSICSAKDKQKATFTLLTYLYLYLLSNYLSSFTHPHFSHSLILVTLLQFTDQSSEYLVEIRTSYIYPLNLSVCSFIIRLFIYLFFYVYLSIIVASLFGNSSVVYSLGTVIVGHFSFSLVIPLRCFIHCQRKWCSFIPYYQVCISAKN